MNFRLALRFLLRERRAGELRLLVLALVIAVASLSSVGFLSDRVKAALEREAHQMLGGDLLLIADRPWARADASPLAGESDETVYRRALADGLEGARTATFPSMVTIGEGDRLLAQLADIKAVSLGYPLRGRLRVASGDGLDRETAEVPARGTVWLDDRLASVLDAGVGASVKVGNATLTVSAILTLEPDRGVSFFSVAPRLLMRLEDLAASGLIQTGSRVTYRLLLAGDEKKVSRFTDWVKPQLERGQRLEDTRNARPEMRLVLDRAQRFLGLAAMLAVVIAAVGVALAVRRYLQRHLDGFAVMRCLGATQGALQQLVLIQFVVLGLVASAIGVVLGFAAHEVLHRLLRELLATPLPAPGWIPAGQGMAVGVALLLAFALPPVLHLRNVSTVRVIRRELGAPALPAIGSALLGGAVLIGLLFWVAGDVKLGAWVSLGFVLGPALFVGLAWLAVRAIGSLAKRWPGQSAIRLGVVSLGRRPGAVAVQVSVLAIGFLALLLLTVTRDQILTAWKNATPADAPNRFVINIQPDQLDAVRASLQKNRLDATLQPMVRGRLAELNGQAVRAADYADERAQRLVEREFNLSWRDDLPTGNTVSAGRWFGPADRGQAVVSVEEGLAKTLGLKLGDQLRFNIAGTPQDARVVGLRKLNWDSMQVNFFVVFPSRVIDQQPASYITAFYLPPGRESLSSAFVREFPNLTVIDVSAILRQLNSVIAQVSRAVEFLFVFTLAAGFVVLYAALLSVVDERQHELAILRALGAGKAQLGRALASEFAVIGALAGLIAALGAVLAGQLLNLKVFELSMPAPWWIVPTAFFGAALLVSLVGRLAIRRLLMVSPLEVLRAEA